MTITPQTVITLGTFLTACGAILAALIKGIRWLDGQRQQDTELKEIREEQCVLVYGVLACLDGLKQLGANGNVTKAHDAMDKHINKAAHKKD